MKNSKLQIITVILLLLVVACGKKALPIANLSEDAFTWLNIGATFTNDFRTEENLSTTMQAIATDNIELKQEIAQEMLNENLDTSCLTIFGQIQGNIDNVNTIIVESQGLTDDCKNCSFVAEMSQTYVNQELQSLINYETNTFQLNYCPQRGYDEYRWRLLGINKVKGVPEVESQVIITR